MEAMDKIRDELAGNSNPGVQMIGEAMTALLMAEPELSDKILKEGKTLAGAFNAVKDYASKNKTGGFAIVLPAKAAEIVAKYWDIDIAAMKRAVLAAEMESMGERMTNDIATGKATVKDAMQEYSRSAKSMAASLDLDALLGGL